MRSPTSHRLGGKEMCLGTTQSHPVQDYVQSFVAGEGMAETGRYCQDLATHSVLWLGPLQLGEAGVLPQLSPPPEYVPPSLEGVRRVRRHVALQQVDRLIGLAQEGATKRL